MSIPDLRKKSLALTEQESFELLTRSDVGILSTVSEDGLCYGVPVNYAVTNGAIYIHGYLDGFKIKNIRYNNKVSFTVVGKNKVMPDKFDTLYESVIVYGKASFVSDDAEKRMTLITLCEKFCKGFLDQAENYIEKDIGRTTVIKIDIEKITGKANKE